MEELGEGEKEVGGGVPKYRNRKYNILYMYMYLCTIVFISKVHILTYE